MRLVHVFLYRLEDVGSTVPARIHQIRQSYLVEFGKTLEIRQEPFEFDVQNVRFAALAVHT